MVFGIISSNKELTIPESLNHKIDDYTTQDTTELIQDESYLLLHNKKSKHSFSTGISQSPTGHLISLCNLATSLSTSSGLSDHDVISATYQKEGIEGLSKLNGDWIFIDFNTKNHTINIVKDHFGYGKLIYGRIDNYFYFSSSMPMLKKLVGRSLRLNTQKLQQMVSFQLDDDTFDQTLFDQFFYQLPGHQTMIDLDSGTIQLKRYWNPITNNKADKSKADVIPNLDHLFHEVVASRIKVQGHQGIMLSSGYDSTTVAYYLSGNTPEKVRSFTSIPLFDNHQEWTISTRKGDESDLVSKFCAEYPNIQPKFLKSENRKVLESIKAYTDIIGEPAFILGNCHWMLDLIMYAKNEGIQQIWTGQIGNFVLSYTGSPSSSLMDSFLVLGEVINLLRYKRDYDLSWRQTIQQFLIKPFLSPILRKLRVNKSMSNSHTFPHLLAQKPVESSNDLIQSEVPADSSLIRNYALKLFSNTSMIYGELMSHFNIIFSDPFSDRRLIDYSFSLPDSEFRRHGVIKYLVKRLMKERLPKEILYHTGPKAQQAADLIPRIRAEKDDFQAFIDDQKSNANITSIINLQELQKIFNLILSASPSELNSKPYINVFLLNISICHFLETHEIIDQKDV
jgi:asparagine synthase (glutamine-hydrolysing)